METLDSSDSLAASQTRLLVAEVISIGDEMTSGARVDTNAAWISRRLGDLGCDVQFHSTVGDDLANNVDVFRIAIQRADIVVCTGGLGPTQDDLTRASLAQVAGVGLERDEPSLRHIKNLFARRDRSMPPSNEIQAMFPVGSRVIFNPQGTAPGIDFEILRDAALATPTGRMPSREGTTAADGKSPACRVFAFPGVPAEMKQMFEASAAPRIGELSGGGGVIRHHVMKFFGTGESDMESRLGDMIARGRQPRVGITVSSATISLRITATGRDDDHCVRMIEQTRAEILQRAGEFHFGDGESYEQCDAIFDSLAQAGQTLGVVEIGHAARLADWMSGIESSDVLRGALAVPSMDVLRQRFGAAQGSEPQTSKAQEDDMWRSAAAWLDADWVIGVNGYPALECDDGAALPATDVRLVVVTPRRRVYRTEVSMAGHPSILQARVAKAAMSWMRKVLAR